MQTLDLSTIDDWRIWLSQDQNFVDKIWLVFYTLESGIASIGYKELLDEALCSAWVSAAQLYQ